jgi:starch phosphorylase
MNVDAFAPDGRLWEWFVRLRELALNLRWTWDRETRHLFRDISPALWDQIEDNPWLVLRITPSGRLHALAENPDFCGRLDRIHDGLRRYMAGRGWFHEAYPEETESVVAYFTAECGLTECLPIYAGGLGILSGDHLKAASALGVPLVGVTLLYQEGYGRQVLDADGWQLDRFPNNDFSTMPLQVERNADGWPLMVRVPLPGRALALLVWRAQVGRTPLYLLDANIPINTPSDRGITAQLYGGDREMRLQQEMALGIGGWRALAAAGLSPQVCHLNEGHAAFVVLERARTLMQESGGSFRDALTASAAGNVFTTHTPVPAGFDLFSPDLIARFFAPYAAELGISTQELIGLGRINPDAAEPFNMAILALNHCNSCNGVSQLHAGVSRRLFRPRFPRFPDEEIPISAVTNGIHTDTWLAEGTEKLLQQSVAPEVDEQPDRVDWERVAGISDHELWDCLNRGRQRLVDFARVRLRAQMAQRGVAPDEAAARSDRVLDPAVLTIGFARRFATYKRATLFMHDPERLRRLLLDPRLPIQLVIAGKAHPDDATGKALIQQVVQFARAEDVRHRIAFLEDYDMRATGRMVQGVDVWLNTPRRPMEASGTSGMKVLPNGGLNLSVRDGWWAEAYEPGVGWAIGDSGMEMDPAQQDAADAAHLYELLEREIVPLYYDRGPDGVPHGWIAMVKNSMRKLCPRFNTNRMVRQYVEEHYLPAARRYRTLTGDQLASARALADWEAAVRAHWGEIQFEGAAAHPQNGVLQFQARIRLGALRPEDVAVELFAEPLNGSTPEIVPMRLRPADADVYTAEGQVPAHRPPSDYTVRLVPRHPNADQPLDLTLILWEH